MKVSKETWLRTALLLVTLLNELLTAAGKNPLPFSENTVYQGVSALMTAAASLWAWWENNSFTANAVRADAYYEELRKGGKTK